MLVIFVPQLKAFEGKFQRIKGAVVAQGTCKQRQKQLLLLLKCRPEGSLCTAIVLNSQDPGTFPSLLLISAAETPKKQKR